MAKILAERPSRSNQTQNFKINIALLYGISFLNGTNFVAPIIIPFFSSWGGLSFPQIMILQSIYMITIVLTEIPLGAVADLVSRRFSLVLGFVLTFVGILLYSIFPRFCLFVLAEIVWGSASSLISGSDHALLYDSLTKSIRDENLPQEKIVTIFGRYTGFRRVGYMISVPIGSLISVYLGLRSTMVLMVIPTSLAVLASLFLTKVTQQSKGQKSYFKLLSSSFKTIVRNKEFLVLLLDELVVTSLCAHLSMTYQQKLLLLGVENIHFGWIFMLFLLSAIFGFTVFKYLARILNSNRKATFIMTISAGIGLLVLLFAQNLVGVVLGIIITSSCGFSYASIRMSFYQKFISSEARSTVNSTINMIRYISFCIIDLLVGWISGYNLSMVFLTFGCLLIIWAFFSPIKEKFLSKLE